VDTEIRRRKVIGDLWQARVGLGIAVLAAVLGGVWLRIEPVPGGTTWLIVLLLSLLVVLQAAMPLAKARASERTVLRALGADDGAAATFAAVEGGALGAVAGLAGLIVGPLGLDCIWFASATTTGAVAGLLAAKRAGPS
jgi:hypothetical protein